MMVMAVVLSVSAAACVEKKGCIDSRETRTPVSYEVWLNEKTQNAADVEAYATRLKAAGVGDLIPLHLLLRTASSWQACGAQPYAVPSLDLQPRSVKTLQLLAVLKRRELLPTGDVASAYRAPQLNECACGACDSQHLYGAAIDFYPSAAFGKTKVKRLCDFWRGEGRAWKMGISQYAKSKRIHIDTGYKYRTWPKGRSVCSSY
jgi:hypothetical protein